MRFAPDSRAGLGAALVLALSATTAAHSWVERAVKIDPDTHQFTGTDGFARGFISRDAAFNDEEVLTRIPDKGVYDGSEVLSRFNFEANPKLPMLEASAGDLIALLHFENGHTTKLDPARNKPLNGGTIFLYGTTKPKDGEKLFDIHLNWNKDGTGGDGRGKLLATRNFDDGQCYEARNEGAALERAKKLATDPTKPLACQSDIRLPDDLKPGDIYTIYWYWDWPDLNPQVIDMEKTKNGIFPWAGTFVRGQADPNGFPQDAIFKPESYSSTVDIKIVDKAAAASAEKPPADIFNKAIAAQLESNFAVNIDANPAASQAPAGTSTAATPVTTAPPGTTMVQVQTSIPATSVISSSIMNNGATVTVTQTVPATTTVYINNGTTSPAPTSACTQCTKPLKTVTEVQTQYTTVYPGGGEPSQTPGTPQASTMTTLVKRGAGAATTAVTADFSNLHAKRVVPQDRKARRKSWTFGHYL